MSPAERGHALIYEVDVSVDVGRADEFDHWLSGHVDEILGLPGFLSADIERVDSDDPAVVRRSVRYSLEDRAALDAYLEHHAARLRADGVARFGDAMRATRRVLEPAMPRRSPDALPVPAGVPEGERRCTNCGERLTGQYCYQCGQRDKHRLISLWELLRDLIGDLFEVDSRIWRTIFPLLFRPGFLTREYLSGRRVHYTPPLRMYLVLSLVFFVVAGIGQDIEIDGSAADGEFSLSINEDDDEAADEAATDGAGEVAPPAGDALSEEDRETLRRLSEIEGLESLAGLEDLEELRAAGESEDAVVVSDMTDRCDDIDVEHDILWLDRATVNARLKRACERLTAEGGLSRFVNRLTRAVVMVIPAEGPSFGIAPAGT